MTRSNKEKGLGNISSYPPIVDPDMDLIVKDFKAKMYGNPDPKILQEIAMFYVIYYLCGYGRENLRAMKISTFAMATDPEKGLRYIYQHVNEADKNHGGGDTDFANQG